MSNKIPRNATKLDVIFKIETSAKARHMIATKDIDRGWVGITEEGRRYSLFVSMLRNSEVCTIKVIETQEERKIYKVTAWDPWAHVDRAHVCTNYYDSEERAQKEFKRLQDLNKSLDVTLREVTKEYNEHKILPGWIHWSNQTAEMEV